MTEQPLDGTLVGQADQVMAHAESHVDHLIGQWRKCVEGHAGEDNEAIRAHGSFGQFLLESYPVGPGFSSVVVTLVKRLADALELNSVVCPSCLQRPCKCPLRGDSR